MGSPTTAADLPRYGYVSLQQDGESIARRRCCQTHSGIVYGKQRPGGVDGEQIAIALLLGSIEPVNHRSAGSVGCRGLVEKFRPFGE